MSTTEFQQCKTVKPVIGIPIGSIGTIKGIWGDINNTTEKQVEVHFDGKIRYLFEDEIEVC